MVSLKRQISKLSSMGPHELAGAMETARQGQRRQTTEDEFIGIGDNIDPEILKEIERETDAGMSDASELWLEL